VDDLLLATLDKGDTIFQSPVIREPGRIYKTAA
jgi:hypothetical protein